MVHVAASQLTSSKLCITSNPIVEKPSKLPSPSICMQISFKSQISVSYTYIIEKTGIAPLSFNLPHAEQDQALEQGRVLSYARRYHR